MISKVYSVIPSVRGGGIPGGPRRSASHVGPGKVPVRVPKRPPQAFDGYPKP